jgi:hypothetical protein
MYVCTNEQLIGEQYQGFYELYGHDTSDIKIFYSNALITVTTTFTTIGYGNDVVESVVERIQAMALMFFGVLLVSWIRERLKLYQVTKTEGSCQREIKDDAMSFFIDVVNSYPQADEQLGSEYCKFINDFMCEQFKFATINDFDRNRFY